MNTISGKIYFVFALGFFIHTYSGRAMEGDVSQENGIEFPIIDAFTMDFAEHKDLIEEAVMHLTDFAHSGNVNAQWSLGLFYEDEMDFHPNYQNLTKAEYYLKQAAKELNNYTAYFHLARFYHNGESNCAMQAQVYYGYAYKLWLGENNFNEAQLKYYEIEWNLLKQGSSQIDPEDTLADNYCNYIFNLYKGLCAHHILVNGGGLINKQHVIGLYMIASQNWSPQFGENVAKTNLAYINEQI